MKSVSRSSIPAGSTIILLAFAMVFGGAGGAIAGHEPDNQDSSGRKADAQPLTIPEYVSPLKNFKIYKEQQKKDWRTSNNIVGEIGGWRVYAEEAFEEEGLENDGNSGKSDEDSKDIGEKQ